MVNALTASATRRRLHAEMARVLDTDPGLYTSAPHSMPDEAYERQRTWARALMACHSMDIAAGVYSSYARIRQETLAVAHPGLDTWGQAAQAGIPVPEWHRDDHRFLCELCPAFPVVIERDRGRRLCRVCARRYVPAPRQVAPLWAAHAHQEFEFPGRSQDVKYQPDALVPIVYPDGETRHYATGEAALFLEQYNPLPRFNLIASSSGGPSRDRINLRATAVTSRDDRQVRIEARLVYDPAPDSALTLYPYGFRLRSARVTTTTAGSSVPTVHTDLHTLLATVLNHLYPAAVTADS